MADETKHLIEPMIFDQQPDPKPVDPENGLIKPMDFDVRTKGIEEKVYIILYKIESDEKDPIYENIYSVKIGRTETYNDIKEKLLSGLNIDIHKSLVITETKQTETKTGDRKYFLMPIQECGSVYSFCITVSEYYSGDPFNIEDFSNTPIPEDPNTMLSELPNYLTPEQQEYRQMMEESMRRDRMFTNWNNGENTGVNV